MHFDFKYCHYIYTTFIENAARLSSIGEREGASLWGIASAGNWLIRCGLQIRTVLARDF